MRHGVWDHLLPTWHGVGTIVGRVGQFMLTQVNIPQAVPLLLNLVEGGNANNRVPTKDTS